MTCTFYKAPRIESVLAGILSLVTMLAIPLTGARADDFDAAKYFKGKTVRLVVDFKPGGGTDIQARYFAAHLPQFVPGTPRMTVTNLFPQPAGRNFVWKSAPDGLTLAFMASLGIGDELIDKTAEFESDKFTQIGSHAKRDMVLLMRGTLPYKTLLDAKGGKIPITIAEPLGSADDISGKVMGVGMLALWLDIPLRIATVANGGLADSLLMIERGDVNTYIAGSHWYALPTLRPGWFAKGYVRPIADMSHPDAPSIPNSEISMPVPNVVTWLTDEQRTLWNGLYLPEVLSGKGIAGPPNMRPEIAKALRDAYANAVNDPTFAKGIEKLQGQPVALIRGEKLQELVADAHHAFKQEMPHFNETRQQVYDRLAK